MAPPFWSGCIFLWVGPSSYMDQGKKEKEVEWREGIYEETGHVERMRIDHHRSGSRMSLCSIRLHVVSCCRLDCFRVHSITKIVLGIFILLF